jgi:hypothetical protein
VNPPTKYLVGFACCLIVCSSAAGNGSTADADKANAVTPLTKAIGELAVPDSPAFAVLDVTPSSVTRPGTTSALGVGLLQGLDANGNLQSGLATDFSPYLLANGNTLTINQYRRNGKADNGRSLLGNLANIQFSLATAKGSSSDDKSIKLAAGLRYTIFDRGDPFIDGAMDTCMQTKAFDAAKDIRKKWEDLEKSIDPTKLTPEQILDMIKNSPIAAEESQAIEKGAKTCRDEHAKSAWNAGAWDVGIAPTWTSATGKTNDLKSSGYGAWTSYSLPLGNRAQIIANVKYRTKEMIADPANSAAQIQQDTFSAGLRLRYGNERRTFLVEGIYIDGKQTGRPSDNSYRYLVGGEFRITDSMWLELLTGATSGNAFKKDDGFITSHFQWAFTGSSQLN